MVSPASSNFVVLSESNQKLKWMRFDHENWKQKNFWIFWKKGFLLPVLSACHFIKDGKFLYSTKDVIFLQESRNGQQQQSKYCAAFCPFAEMIPDISPPDFSPHISFPRGQSGGQSGDQTWGPCEQSGKARHWDLQYLSERNIWMWVLWI